MSNLDPHLNRGCALPESYPEPQVSGRNRYYAMLLLEDYAGNVSEMTAINQYIYHYLTLEEYEDVAKLEKCIAIIEMHHLELLGETIYMLGLPPKYWTLPANRPIYWSSNYVYYGSDICDKLAANIAAEQAAIRQYKQHQQMIDDPCIKRLLERIIKDEEYHLTLFRKAAKKYCHRMG